MRVKLKNNCTSRHKEESQWGWICYHMSESKFLAGFESVETRHDLSKPFG